LQNDVKFFETLYINVDKSTKAITLAATSKNLETQQRRHIYRAVCKVNTRRLRFVLNVLRAIHRIFFYFFSSSLKINCMWPVQDRSKVWWRPGQERNLAPPFSKLISCQSKYPVLKYLRHCWDFSTPPVIWRSVDLPPRCLSGHVASKYCWLLNQDLWFHGN